MNISIFKLTVGDGSLDGHGRSETVFFETNCTYDEINVAYRQSEQMTGIDFSSLASTSDDNEIPEHALTRLIELGINDHLVTVNFEPFGEDEISSWFDDIDHYSEILAWFISLSIPEGKFFRFAIDAIRELSLSTKNMGYGLF